MQLSRLRAPVVCLEGRQAPRHIELQLDPIQEDLREVWLFLLGGCESDVYMSVIATNLTEIFKPRHRLADLNNPTCHIADEIRHMGVGPFDKPLPQLRE
jgi:hypothetical protein